MALGVPAPAPFEWSSGLIEAIERFHARPSLWDFVHMGDVCTREGQTAAALACFRVAAVKFAQRGLLSQALLASRRMLDIAPGVATHAEVARLIGLIGKGDLDVHELLYSSRGPVEDLLKELLDEARPAVLDVGTATPFLSHLDGPLFADLAASARLAHAKEGEAVVREGDLGRVIYIIAKGRVLVRTTGADGSPLSLTSLSPGDFFGENGFFTGAPRSATVEALENVEVFEIDRSLYNVLAQGHPHLHGILLDFYKERIVDTLLAKSDIFGLLSAAERHTIVQKFTPRVFRPGETVIKQGAVTDPIYLIKDGEAEVVSEYQGVHTTLSVIGPGTLVGEIAALRSIPRTASVVARGKLEAMELGGADFMRLIGQNPDLKARILHVVQKRTRDNMDRLVTRGTLRHGE